MNECRELRNLHNPEQHSFLSGRSCLSQLLRQDDRTLEAVEDKQKDHVTYTDFLNVTVELGEQIAFRGNNWQIRTLDQYF